jgi:hypothetical protein
MSADMFAQQFMVRVKVDNPNDLEIAVSGLEYDIFLMGDSLPRRQRQQLPCCLRRARPSST